MTFEGHGDEPLAHANFSPDGRFISTSSRGEGTVRIWDAETGDPLFTLADPGGEVVCCQAEFSPDGSVVVVGLFDGTMRIWSTDDGGEVARIPFDGSPAFSPDGERLWLGSCVGEWRLPEGGPDAFCVDAEAVTDVSWSTDGALVATAQFNGNLSVWDADTGDNVLTLAPGVAGFPYDVELGEEGTRLAGGFSDGTVRVWDLDRGVAVPSMTLNAHGSVVQSMKFTPDGTRLATASEDGVVQVWDVGRLGAAEALTVLGTAGFGFSPDGSRLAIGGDDGAVQVYDAASGETIRTVTMPARVWAVAFSPDGQRLAASGERGAIAVWDAQSGESVLEVEGLEGGPFFDLAWVDGTTLATTSDAGTTAVWDAETGDQIVSMPRGGQSLALSPDGSLLATTQTADSVTESATITIWNTVTGEPTAELHAEIAQYAVAFSADGRLISAGGLDGRITTWNPSTGRLVSTMSGNLGHIWDLSFAPSGHLLASASEDGSVRLWDPGRRQGARHGRATGSGRCRRPRVRRRLQPRRLAPGGDGGQRNIASVLPRHRGPPRQGSSRSQPGSHRPRVPAVPPRAELPAGRGLSRSPGNLSNRSCEFNELSLKEVCLMCRRFGRPWLVATALSLSIVIGAAVAFASMNEQTTSEHRILQYRHLQECRGPGDGCVRGARTLKLELVPSSRP